MIGSILEQEKGAGLLKLPTPDHSGRQRRPHKGFERFVLTVKNGVAVFLF
jgi:hypothetical protein